MKKKQTRHSSDPAVIGTLRILGLAILLAGAGSRAQSVTLPTQPEPTPPKADESAATTLRTSAGGDRIELIESLRNEARAAIARGIQWLHAQQQEQGSWSNPMFPALTGLPVWALAQSGETDSESVRRALAYLRAQARDNGAIFVEPKEAIKGGGLSSYNTAICMVALHLAGHAEDVPLVQRARAFMARSQHLGGDVYRGGFGYDPQTDRAYTDLSNSYIAFEAMRMTESVEDLRKAGEERVDLNWAAARDFLQKTQNDPAVNPQPWATSDPNERGGFAYHPEQTRAGTFTDADGVVRFRSQAGMTYAGLLSYIYAEVDRNDPRVEATINWVVRNWALDADAPAAGNPARPDVRVDPEGLYYQYNVMAKGLAAYGREVFRPADRAPFNWRVELIEKLLRLQKTDPQTGGGYWINDVGRYWESDPVLVTSYALIALQIALGPDA
ncbi:MAG: prenyltransferase/squalene oxidase repeat-containing protein [Kiritimatiellia bacterium]|nr:prenyltransferase/squalene oxidase repeat-containing protein [Kiritimatiellia bacterium]